MLRSHTRSFLAAQVATCFSRQRPLFQDAALVCSITIPYAAAIEVWKRGVLIGGSIEEVGIQTR
jgi:hypothetical protein